MSEYTSGVLFLKKHFDAVFQLAQNGALRCNVNHLNDKWSVYCVDEFMQRYTPPEALADIPLLLFMNYEDHFWSYRIFYQNQEVSGYIVGEDAIESFVQSPCDVAPFSLFDVTNEQMTNLIWALSPLYLKSRGRFDQVEYFKAVLGIEEMTWMDYDRCYDVRDAEEDTPTDVFFFPEPNQKNIVFSSVRSSGARSMYQRPAQGYYDHSGLRKFGHQGRFGFMDESGNVFVEPKFERAHPFSGGLASVVMGNQFGFINVFGDMVIAPRFSQVGLFVDDRVVALDGQTYVILNGDGTVVHTLEGIQSIGTTFEEGLTPFVNKNELWGFINEDGEEVIAPQFELAQTFLNGLAKVRANGRWFYIRKDGSRFEYEGNYELDDFSEGFAIGKQSGKRGSAIINTKGEVVCEVTYSIFSGFSEGLAVATTPRTFGHRFYINHFGEVVLDGCYRSAEPFINGLARVSIEHAGRTKFTFIDKRGMPTFRPQRFIYVGDVHYPSDLIDVQKKDWTYVNRRTGEDVHPKWP